MTKEREALKLALKALEMVKANADDWQERTGKEIKGWMQPVNHSRTAIKEALAQPEQEPVAIVEASWNDDEGFMLVKRLAEKLPKGSHLYTTPPQRTWVGLTDDDLRQIILVAIGVAEAKLKEKNT